MLVDPSHGMLRHTHDWTPTDEPGLRRCSRCRVYSDDEGATHQCIFAVGVPILHVPTVDDLERAEHARIVYLLGKYGFPGTENTCKSN